MNAQTEQQAKTVGILIYNGVEVLDFCGPFEVFSVTRLPNRELPTDPSPFKVVLIAETSDPIQTTGGMQVLPHVTFESCPPLHILVVPGGIGSRTERYNASVLDFLRRHSTAALRSLEILSSVCTGSLLLAQAGLLKGQSATTHWAALDLMEQDYPDVTVVRDKHWIVVDHLGLNPLFPGAAAPNNDASVLNQCTFQALFTSAGISAGIDMSLKIVERVLGSEVARRTARQMEYRYPESDDRRI